MIESEESGKKIEAAENNDNFEEYSWISIKGQKLGIMVLGRIFFPHLGRIFGTFLGESFPILIKADHLFGKLSQNLCF